MIKLDNFYLQFYQRISNNYIIEIIGKNNKR